MRKFNLTISTALAMFGIMALLTMMRVEVSAAPETICLWTGPQDSVPRNWSSVAYWDCGAVPGVGDTAVISGYSRVVDMDTPVTVDHLILLDGSTINGYNTLTVTGSMEWNGFIAGGAHLSPTGAVETVVVAPGAIMTLTDTNWGNHSHLDQGRLVNYGTIEQSAGHILGLKYAVIDNRTGGLYHVSNGMIDKNAIFGDDGGSFENAGTLVKDGNGLFTLRAAFFNVGQVNVLSDTLRVEMAGGMNVLTHTGSFSVARPGTLAFVGTDNNFQPASSLSGAGTIRFEAASTGHNFYVRGVYDVSGLTDLAQGTQLYLDTPGGGVMLGKVSMSYSSRLRGTNDITVTEVLTIAGNNAIVEGSSSNANTLNIAAGARMMVNMDGGLSFRTLNNYGTVEQASGRIFAMLNNAVFNNHPSGVYTVTNGSMNGAGSVNNDGRITKLGLGDFDISFGISLANSGIIEVMDGLLKMSGPFVQTSGETFLGSSTLENSNYSLIFNGGKLYGNGAIDLFSGFRLENNGAIIQPTGLLSLDEDYVQGVSGTLQIDIGGLVPVNDYGVFEVLGQATLDGRLTLTPTNNFLPASGDIFRVMRYGTHSGQFAQVERGLGLAFGPEYQSDSVVVSDNPTLVEFSQKPDRRTILPGSNSGYSLRLTNSHTETISTTFKNILPAGFTYIAGSATSNLPLLPPTVTLNSGVQTLIWPTLNITPGALVTIHFGVAVTQTVGVYTNTAEAIVTPTIKSPRTIRLYDSVDVSLSPTINTVIAVTNGLAYPPTEPNGLWTIALPKGQPTTQVGVVITSTPVCVLPACGPLKRFYALHNGQTFSLTLVSGTTSRYRGEIPVGQFNFYERIFLVPVFHPPAGSQREYLSANVGTGNCERVGLGYSVYVIFDPIDGVTPCDPTTGEPLFFDPSGNVTDAQTGAPIQGATVTLYRVTSAWPDTRTTTRDCRTIETRPGGITGTWDSLPPAAPNLGLVEDPLFIPAAIDPTINPQMTDEAGHYGWDVVRGCWYVKVEAEGYLTQYTPVVGVPPEVTDLHVALEPVISLMVNKSGNGDGRISSNPPGIDCGGDCQEDFNNGTVVTLTAAANISSTFNGWSGTCTGTGTCIVTMDTARQITALFTLNINDNYAVFLPIVMSED
ncbi:MAG: hypothetical protein GY796_32250 [Chloroflexi bacterium]|nr:hypothetical protein [Chloroflexota bacterium]